MSEDAHFDNDHGSKPQKAEKFRLLRFLKNWVKSKFVGKDGTWLYRSFEPTAHLVKVALQMFVGVLIIFSLAWYFAADIGWLDHSPFSAKEPLEIVATGLEYAAGIELAYMLFTDGPDEAIQPLILGLAAATLMAISSGITPKNTSITAIIAAPVLTLCIGILLWLQRNFLPNTKK